MEMKHILDGIKVLDFTQYLAGPTASRVLAHMGAEVIKVEWAPDGDYSRKIMHLKEGRSAYFIQHNRGKKSLCMDLRHPRAIELLLELVPKMDILLENFSPGVIGRLGLGWETVRAINPQLIMCSISGFGQTGPMANRPGYDHVAQAYSGVSSMIGEPGGPPSLVGMAVGDVGTGMNAVAAINGALFYRTRPGGSGQYLDCSLLDTYFNLNDCAMEMYTASNGAFTPSAGGQHHFVLAPVGFFKGNSRYMVIMCATPKQWESLCAAMDKPELITDPRFLDHPERLNNLDALIKIIEDWIKEIGDDEEIGRIMKKHWVPHAPVLTVPEAIRQPHPIERGNVLTVRDDILGEFQIPGIPFRFSEFPGHLQFDAPLLGEHNEEVLCQHLGLATDEIRKLEQDGVLTSEPN